MLREQYIRSFDGTKLYTDVSGSGPIPMVLCDGLGCDGFIWQHLKPVFEEKCTFYHFHYRGHGLSEAPALQHATSVRDLRSDLEAVFDHYQLDKALILGHSMGVQVGLDFAIHHPERTAGIVPMCGSYGHPLDTFHNTDLMNKVLPYLRRLVTISPKRAQQFWTKGLTTELAYQFAMHLEVNGKILRREEFGPYFQHLAAMDVRVFLGLVEHLADHSTERHLPTLDVPALVVAGQHDTFTPAWLSERMVDLLPDAELLMIPGGTHVAPIEIPELFHLRLKKFLRKRITPQFEAATPKATKAKPVKKKATKKVTSKPKAKAKRAAVSSLD
ncbi:MAG: alpha/beta hydrolase [Myxococcota bacterium]|nr:alpha/beta hydrolase [Myxococcota bacterium]